MSAQMTVWPRECAGEDGGGEEAEDDAFKHDEVCVSSNWSGPDAECAGLDIQVSIVPKAGAFGNTSLWVSQRKGCAVFQSTQQASSMKITALALFMSFGARCPLRGRRACGRR